MRIMINVGYHMIKEAQVQEKSQGKFLGWHWIPPKSLNMFQTLCTKTGFVLEVFFAVEFLKGFKINGLLL